MITRELKLKLTKKQDSTLSEWLWILTGVYNWAIRKIELNVKDKIYYSKMDFQNLLVKHGKKVGIPSHVLQGILVRAWLSWNRCFNKIARKPKLKGNRNKLNSIPFPDLFKVPEGNKISVPGLGRIRYFKQELPEGKIKCGRIIKRADGWFLQLTIDTDNIFAVKETDVAVGIDPGFKSLFTLSDGTKFENPRELRIREKRLGQAQRGKHKKLTAKLQLKTARIRKDRNHKISRKIIENYKTIYYSDDNFKTMSKKFGKSIGEAGLGQLIGFMAYKGRTVGRNVIPVKSKYTTMTCSNCGALTGPKGLGGLAVRQWDCDCGSHNDRDVNSALNVLYAGVGATPNGVQNRLQ